MALEVQIFNSSGTDFLPKKKIINVLEKLLTDKKISEGWINVIYVDDKEIIKLNKKFLKHNYPTDVLSFQLGENCLEGEVYISVDTAKKQAVEYKVSLTNELMRLAVHGTLHLIGYDDSSNENRGIMNSLENRYIK